jgi:outer membrane lipopolysaccharide assembly protein LptE/RlpB
MRLLLLMVVLLLGACGYHFPGQGGSLPGGIERIHVSMFDNLTREPLLENRLTTEVIDIFSGRPNIRLVPIEDAQAELSGRILSYDSSSIAYQQGDQISKYRAAMVVAVRLQGVDNQRLLWDGTVRWQTEYDAAADKMLQGDDERRAQDELARRLAEEIFSRLLDDF